MTDRKEKERRIAVQAASIVGVLDELDTHIVDGEPYLDNDGKEEVLFAALFTLMGRRDKNDR